MQGRFGMIRGNGPESFGRAQGVSVDRATAVAPRPNRCRGVISSGPGLSTALSLVSHLAQLSASLCILCAEFRQSQFCHLYPRILTGIRTLEPREGNQLAQGHTATPWQAEPGSTCLGACSVSHPRGEDELVRPS